MKKTINTILALSILMTGSLAQASEGIPLETRLAQVNNYLPALTKIICNKELPDGEGSLEAKISVFQYRWIFESDASNEHTNRELRKLVKKKQLKAIASIVHTDSDGNKSSFSYNLYFSKFFHSNDVNEYWYTKYTLKTYPYYDPRDKKNEIYYAIEVDQRETPSIKIIEAQGGKPEIFKNCKLGGYN